MNTTNSILYYNIPGSPKIDSTRQYILQLLWLIFNNMFHLYLDPPVWHEPIIFSSSLSDGSTPGCKAIGAKSLDRGLGDVHTWPHSHYLMRPCNGVGGWPKMAVKVTSCVGAVQSQWSGEGRDWPLRPLYPPCLPTPFSPPHPYPALTSAWSFAIYPCSA